jgi:hypothetical protein
MSCERRASSSACAQESHSIPDETKELRDSPGPRSTASVARRRPSQSVKASSESSDDSNSSDSTLATTQCRPHRGHSISSATSTVVGCALIERAQSVRYADSAFVRRSAICGAA